VVAQFLAVAVDVLARARAADEQVDAVQPHGQIGRPVRVAAAGRLGAEHLGIEAL